MTKTTKTTKPTTWMIMEDPMEVRDALRTALSCVALQRPSSARVDDHLAVLDNLLNLIDMIVSRGVRGERMRLILDCRKYDPDT